MNHLAGDERSSALLLAAPFSCAEVSTVPPGAETGSGRRRTAAGILTCRRAVPSPVQPVQSKHDLRSYKLVHLPNNGLQVLLISDPDAEKAAACMRVRVGHFSDPPDMPGLTHFLEHMLFLGTEKYEDEAAYKRFLAQHGGSSNASTGSEFTQYHFQVLAPHLDGALDRFAQFFISPLFTPSCVEREMKAVHSEYMLKYEDDSRRLFQFLKSISGAAPYGSRTRGGGNEAEDEKEAQEAPHPHPWTKMSCGNLKTLKIDEARARLIEHYRRHYSAASMRLCILGRESLSELEAGLSRFAAIPSRYSVPKSGPDFGRAFGSPWSPRRHLGSRMHRLVPVKDKRQVVVYFPQKSSWARVRSRSHRLCAHVLGHEGKGSALSLLKKRKLGNGISAFTYVDTSFFALFAVRVDLTPAGDTEEGVAEVCEIIFAAASLLRRAAEASAARPTGGDYDVLRRIAEECAIMANLSFTYANKSRPRSVVRTVANRMHTLLTPVGEDTGIKDGILNGSCSDAASLLSGGSHAVTYDAARVKEFAAGLHPDKAFLVWCSKRHQAVARAQEKWYGTFFDSAAPTPECMERWKVAASYDDDGHAAASAAGHLAALSLPPPNPFLPRNMRILGRDDALAVPSVLPLASRRELSTDHDDTVWWLCSGKRWQRPKGVLTIWLPTGDLERTSTNRAGSTMFNVMARDALTEELYAAGCAGLNVSVSSSSIQLDGFNDSLLPALRIALGKIARLRREGFDPERFRLLHEKRVRARKNWSKSRPIAVAGTALAHALVETYNWPPASLPALEGLTYEKFGEVSRSVCHARARAVKVYAHGNVSREVAMQAFNLTREAVSRDAASGSAPPPTWPSRRVVVIPLGHSVLHVDALHADETNSALVAYFQVGARTPQLAALVSVLGQVAKQPAFTTLRTTEQLGYIVSAGSTTSGGVLGFKVRIQSSVRRPPALDQRVEAFLGDLRVTIAASGFSDTLARHKDALARSLLKPDETVYEEYSRFSRAIHDDDRDWWRKKTAAEVVRNVTVSALLDFFDDVFAKNRRKLSVYVYAAKGEVAGRRGQGPPAPLVPATTSLEIDEISDWKTHQAKLNVVGFGRAQRQGSSRL